MKTSYYQTITLLFAFLLAVNIFLNPLSLGNDLQEITDRACNSHRFEYSKIDFEKNRFSCCSVFPVSDWENQQTTNVEGCSRNFTLEGLG